MGLWLLDPDGFRNYFGADVVTADDASLIVLQMLIIDGCEWVEVRSDEDPELATRWTVLERDGNGGVTKIAVRESSGEVSVIGNTAGAWDE